MPDKKLNPYFMPAGVQAYKDGKPITSVELELFQRKRIKEEKPWGKDDTSTKKNNPILQKLSNKKDKKPDKPKMREGGFTKRGGMYKKGYVYSDD